jgi:hypothetical protein
MRKDEIMQSTIRNGKRAPRRPGSQSGKTRLVQSGNSQLAIRNSQAERPSAIRRVQQSPPLSRASPPLAPPTTASGPAVVEEGAKEGTRGRVLGCASLYLLISDVDSSRCLSMPSTCLLANHRHIPLLPTYMP